MKFLKDIVDKLKPTFSEGGKLSMFHSVFDGFETFLFVPNSTSKRVGSQIHDAIDSKRTMIMVVIALMPAMLFGMYNVGYQHFLAIGEDAGTLEEVYEPFLIKEGFLKRTPRGREATDLAFRHLGRTPRRLQADLFGPAPGEPREPSPAPTDKKPLPCPD